MVQTQYHVDGPFVSCLESKEYCVDCWAGLIVGLGGLLIRQACPFNCGWSYVGFGQT